jgi:hypothetical protein
MGKLSPHTEFRPRRPESKALKVSLILWKNVNKLGDIFSVIKVKAQVQNVDVH